MQRAEGTEILVLTNHLQPAAAAPTLADDANVHVQLSPADVLPRPPSLGDKPPRSPLLVRPQSTNANFVIADAYAAHAQSGDSDTGHAGNLGSTVKKTTKPKTQSANESDNKPRAKAKPTLKSKPALPTKPAADEFDQAFILHAYPYKETSLILETFTRKHGRVSMVARGAKRPHGALTSARSPFQPLNLVWMGKSDLKTLKTAESGAIFPQLQGTALLSAFYVNELILKLCVREDPHPLLFDAYQATLQRLIEVHYHAQVAAQLAPTVSMQAADFSTGDLSDYVMHLKRVKRAARAGQMVQIAAALRQFELTLFQHLGYGLNLVSAAQTGLAILPDADYRYVPDYGAVAQNNADLPQTPNALREPELRGLPVRGKTLLDIAQNNYDDPVTQQQSKQLMRFIINHLLGNQVLHTRSMTEVLLKS